MKVYGHRKTITLTALFMIILYAILFFALSASAADKSTISLASTAPGQTLYTQFTLFYEHNVHRTVNYRKGVLVPVNTAVKYVKSNAYSIVVTLPDGQNLKLENNQSYSGEGIEGIFVRTFSLKPLDLSVFTEAENNSIMAGEVQPGMRKSAVIVALGYPPKHRTSNLQLNQWQYWRNRFNTFIVYFEKDKVTRVKD